MLQSIGAEKSRKQEQKQIVTAYQKQEPKELNVCLLSVFSLLFPFLCTSRLNSENSDTHKVIGMNTSTIATKIIFH